MILVHSLISPLDNLQMDALYSTRETVPVVFFNESSGIANSVILPRANQRVNPKTIKIRTYSGITLLKGSFFLMVFDYSFFFPAIIGRGLKR